MPKSKSLWEIAQEDFVAAFPNKNQFVFQFHDARAAMGAAQSRRVFTTSHPSDFLVTDQGQTFYAEVKSSENEVSFPFSNIEKGQWIAATRLVAASGYYYFFLKSEHLKQWFKVPASVILEQYHGGIKSIKWSLLTAYKWSI